MSPALSAAFALALTVAPGLRVVEVKDGRAGPNAALFLRAGESGTVAALVTDGRHCFSLARAAERARACERMPAALARRLRWFVAVPEPDDYDNLAHCGAEALRRGCHQPLRWKRQPLPKLDGEAMVDVRDVPELAALGTHRLGVELASDPVRPLGEPDVDALFEIVVRRDDTYVGRLTEQLGTPFVHVPVVRPGHGHQTDERLGADCVALVIYGQRRLGRKVPYVAPAALYRFTTAVGAGAVQPGDVLHFGFQTAVLSRDVPPVGVLSLDDLVLHTFHGVAEEVPFGALPYRALPVTVLRWRAGE